jgi:hypothetical protein
MSESLLLLILNLYKMKSEIILPKLTGGISTCILVFDSHVTVKLNCRILYIMSLEPLR